MTSGPIDDSTHGDGTREVAFDVDHGALWITVASAAGVSTLPLPAGGVVVFGRGGGCEVCVDDPSMSRRHAALHIGEGLELEDLGSRNGTYVRGTQLAAGGRIAVGAGDVLKFGSTVVVLQAAPCDRPRRILAHGYFELYLEGECARAAAGGSSFAVARLRVGASDDRAVEQVLALTLAPIDQFASYAPGEYEILMLQIDAAAARARLEELRRQLLAVVRDVSAGLAVYPGDGRTPEEIIAAAAPPGERATSATIRSSTLQRLEPLVRRVAAGNINVLILGETGAGKEVMAQKLHDLSPRARAPLLSLNCAALTETLLESELFGHERGAFTGAVAAKPGLLETAAGGTVFLDEIGEMPPPIQAKLLRVIEQKQVMRVGALKARPIDVRFIAATHRDLEEEVARGRFRQDLFFRLNGTSIVIPPLRERLDELPALAAGFIEQAARQQGVPPPQITPAAMQILRGYSWPGNIRELRNVMERAVLLSSNGIIVPADIPSEKMGRTLPARSASSASQSAIPRIQDAPAPPQAKTLPPMMGGVPSSPVRDDPTTTIRLGSPDAERQRIIDALAQCAGNQTQAAQLLGISRRTLVYRLSEYDLPRPRRRS